MWCGTIGVCECKMSYRGQQEFVRMVPNIHGIKIKTTRTSEPQYWELLWFWSSLNGCDNCEMVHTKRVQEKVQKDITTAITNQTVFVMTEYFRPHWNFKFEKSSIRRWLKVKKKIGEHMSILYWRNSKYFIGQFNELNFCTTSTLW